MKRQRVSSRCTKQCAFSGSPAKPYCSVSSAANSMPSMSCEERRKACGSKRYRLIPRCLTSLHKLGGSMKQLPMRECDITHIRGLDAEHDERRQQGLSAVPGLSQRRDGLSLRERRKAVGDPGVPQQ